MSSGAAPAESHAESRGQQAAARDGAGLDTEHDLGLLLAFLNTTDAESGTDVLDDPQRWQQWCAEHTAVAAPETGTAREFRDLMRESLTHACAHGERDFRSAAAEMRWPVQVRLRAGVPVTVGADAVGAVLAAAARLVDSGHWDRIKICPADDCLWAFYDRSRNRSRTWCSMRVCGNRKKARSWRERHAS